MWMCNQSNEVVSCFFLLILNRNKLHLQSHMVLQQPGGWDYLWDDFHREPFTCTPEHETVRKRYRFKDTGSAARVMSQRRFAVLAEECRTPGLGEQEVMQQAAGVWQAYTDLKGYSLHGANWLAFQHS